MKNAVSKLLPVASPIIQIANPPINRNGVKGIRGIIRTSPKIAINKNIGNVSN